MKNTTSKMEIIRTKEEIEEQIGKAIDTKYNSRYPAMSFEAGMLDMIDWLTGESDTPPIED